MPGTLLALSNELAGNGIRRCEQGRYSVAKVIVRGVPTMVFTSGVKNDSRYLEMMGITIASLHVQLNNG